MNNLKLDISKTKEDIKTRENVLKNETKNWRHGRDKFDALLVEERNVLDQISSDANSKIVFYNKRVKELNKDIQEDFIELELIKIHKDLLIKSIVNFYGQKI